MPAPTNLAEGLRHRATATPDRIALEDDVQSVTYAELHAKVAAMGGGLRRLAAELPADSFLPVMVDRSVDSCVAALACLYSRIAFFPIDSSASAEWLRYLCARAGSPDRFLAGSTFDDRNDPPGCRRISADELEGPPAGNPVDTRAAAGGLVIFTSGTTGVPNGVVIDAATLDERWRRANAEKSEEPSAFRGVILAPLDSLFGLSLLGQVAAGCTTLVIDPSHYSAITLLRRFAEFGPSALALPPQLGRVLAQLPDKEGAFLPTMRRLQTGSEGFRYESLAGLLSILPPSVEVMFGFGATESYLILAYRFTLGGAPEAGAVPLGLPVEADEVRFRPVPDVGDGVVEVVSSGALASGYLGDEEQTRSRFLTDPDGQRWWSSGDLVRMNDDGLYEHLGRSDDIVKIRGKIASPSELEAVLLRIPGIRQAVVVPHEQDAVMRHRSLPATARGKVDRQALMAGPFEAWGGVE